MKSRLLLLGLSAALILCASSLLGQDQGLDRRIATTIRERGQVESASNLEIRCQVTGQTAILWVADDGLEVKKGDLLVKFDASKSEEQLRLVNAEAAQAKIKRIAAKSLVAAKKTQLASIKQVASLQSRAAKLQRDSVVGEGGKLDLQRRNAESEMKVAKAAIAAAEQKVQSWKKQHPDQPLPGDLNLALVTAQESLKIAERTLNFASKERDQQTAALEVEQSKVRLESQVRQLEAERALVTANSELEVAEELLAASVKRQDQAIANLQKCVVHAPRAGTVLHATAAGSRTRFTVEPGAVVREGQAVVRLPDLAQLQVRTFVNETRITRVRPGQQARVTLDALPSNAIAGVVEFVARTARPQTFLSSDIKEYEVIVRLKQPAKPLRIGMTALVEIEAGENR